MTDSDSLTRAIFYDLAHDLAQMNRFSQIVSHDIILVSMTRKAFTFVPSPINKSNNFHDAFSKWSIFSVEIHWNPTLNSMITKTSQSKLNMHFAFDAKLMIMQG